MLAVKDQKLELEKIGKFRKIDGKAATFTDLNKALAKAGSVVDAMYEINVGVKALIKHHEGAAASSGSQSSTI